MKGYLKISCILVSSNIYPHTGGQAGPAHKVCVDSLLYRGFYHGSADCRADDIVAP